MDSYQLGKDIQDIKNRLEKIEAALNTKENVRKFALNVREDLQPFPFPSRPFPGLDYITHGGQLVDNLTQEALIADRQGRTGDADGIRGIRNIVEEAPDNINSSEASEISRDVAKGDYDGASRTAREAVGSKNPD